MITINLATRKQSSGVAGGRDGFGAGGKGLDLNLEMFRQLPIQKIVLIVLIYFGSDYLLTEYQEEELAKVSARMQEVQTRKQTLQVKLSKAKGYEAIKRQLEKDELELKNKIETITHLVEGRRNSYDFLKEVASLISAEVWLDSVSLKESRIELTGFSVGYSQISDFMEALGQTSYVRNIEAKELSRSQAVAGKEIARFRIGGQAVGK